MSACFAAYTLMREKPLVIIVTDSDAQLDKGVTAETRREESREGVRPWCRRFLSRLKDGSLDEPTSESGSRPSLPSDGNVSTRRRSREGTRTTTCSRRSPYRFFPELAITRLTPKASIYTQRKWNRAEADANEIELEEQGARLLRITKSES